MAVTTSISVVESSVLSGKPATFEFTWTDDSGSDVTPSNYYIRLPLNWPGYASALQYPAGGSTVPGSGSLTGVFTVTSYVAEPPESGDTDQWAYTVYLVTEFDDGSVSTSNTLNIQVTPSVIDGTNPLMPVPGELRFDSNQNSALFPVLL